jgi:lipopolysaccharide export LptBFGC system permease protein LptF
MDVKVSVVLGGLIGAFVVILILATGTAMLDLGALSAILFLFAIAVLILIIYSIVTRGSGRR